MAKEVDSKSFDKVISDEKPVLVDFFATWCGPCQMMLPVIEEIGEKAKDFDVVKLDIDLSPDIAAKYNVMSVPTFIIFKEGKEAGRMLGAMPKEMILEKVNSVISSH